MKIDFENLRHTIYSGDNQDWADVMGDFSMLIEDVAYMFKNPVMFTNSERNELFEQFRQVCKCFANDNRTTETLLENLDLNG